MANIALTKPLSSRLYDLSDPKQRAQWEQLWLLGGLGAVRPAPMQRPKSGVRLSVVSPD
jgi:hypothetical protein